MSDIRFDGRVAVVTGAGNGLGRCFALALAARGAAVVVNDLGTAPDGRGRSDAVAQGVVDEIVAAGGRAMPSCETVATQAGGAAIVQTALDAFGRVDIVISNAGFIRNSRLEAMPEADFDAVIETHLKGAFNLAQPAFRAMQQQGYGRFILASSGAGLFGLPYQANYAAAKAGLAGLSHVLALEGASHGIMSNALLPVGLSRGWENMGPEFASMPNHDLTPVMDRLSPDYVAPLVLYLASDRCQATHGLYSAVAGRYARVFTAVTEGWHSPSGAPPSPEDVERHWTEVEDRSVYYEPLVHSDEFIPILRKQS